MNELFVASSYHHIITAITKKVLNNSDMDIIISNMSSGDKYWDFYIDKIKNSGFFRNIYYFDEKKKGPPKFYNIIGTIKYEQFFEQKFLDTLKINLYSYDMIYLINDNMFPGATIVRNKLTYHLCEDTINSFKTHNGKSSSGLLNIPYELVMKVCGFLNYWHPVFGYSNSCKAIEVTSKSDLPKRLPLNKIIIVDRLQQFNNLPKDIKSTLLSIFLTKSDYNFLVNSTTNRVLVLPSIYRRYSQHENEMVRICGKIIDKYENTVIVVKPHPRDNTDYSKYFPDAIILNKAFPIEILNFFNKILFDEVAVIQSTATNVINFSNKIISYHLEDLGEKINFRT